MVRSSPEPMPLCPPHWEQACSPAGIFRHDNAADCPLCGDETYGDHLLCGYCATEAQVCVFDARPVDGSSSTPPAWVAGLEADRRAAREAVARLREEDVRRLEHARPLVGVWRSTATDGPVDARLLFLTTGPVPLPGVLVRVRHGRVAEVSRVTWSLEGDRLSMEPHAPRPLPPGAWNEPLVLVGARTEVTSTRAASGATGSRYLTFPDRPDALAHVGWHFAAVEVEEARYEQLHALARGQG